MYPFSAHEIPFVIDSSPQRTYSGGSCLLKTFRYVVFRVVERVINARKNFEDANEKTKDSMENDRFEQLSANDVRRN